MILAPNGIPFARFSATQDLPVGLSDAAVRGQPLGSRLGAFPPGVIHTPL